MPKMAREPLAETHSYLLIAQYVSTSYLTQEQTSTRLQDSGLPRFRCFSSPFFNKIDLRAFKPLSTLTLFQKYAFSLSPKKHRLIRVHTTVLMRYRLPTLKRSKTIELHVVT